MTDEIKKRIEGASKKKIPKGYTWLWHLMPLEWADIPLSHIFLKKSAKNKDSAVDTVFTNSASHGIILQTEYFEKDIAHSESTEGYYIVEPEDYVYNPRISENAPYGPFKRNDTGTTGIVSPLYTVFAPKREYRQSEFLRYYLDSSQWHKYAYSIANYGARFDRMNITGQELMRLPVAWPPLAEQRRIGEILCQCDRLIQLKRERLEAEQALKRALLQELLERQSGPGWICRSLSELCAFSEDGDWIEAKDQSKEGIRLIQTGNVGVGRYLDKEHRARYVSEETFKRLNCTEVLSGDILISRLPDPIGRACRIPPLKERAITAVDCTILRFEDDLTARWVLQYASSPAYFRRIRALAGGSTRTRISRKELLSLPVPLPAGGDEQRTRVELLEAQDQIVNLLEDELAQWGKKRRALMQLLLTGLVRVVPQ